MTWFDWALIAWLALGGLAAVALVGKPRKPLTPGVAVATILINALIVVGLVMVR
jgi:hypothetical protein